MAATMNSTEQRQRHTQIGELNQKIDGLAEALDAELTERTREIHEIIFTERSDYLREATVAQSAIDAANRAIIAIDRRLESIALEVAAVTTLTFWGRIRWILTGRCE